MFSIVIISGTIIFIIILVGVIVLAVREEEKRIKK